MSLLEKKNIKSFMIGSFTIGEKHTKFVFIAERKRYIKIMFIAWNAEWNIMKMNAIANEHLNKLNIITHAQGVIMICLWLLEYVRNVRNVIPLRGKYSAKLADKKDLRRQKESKIKNGGLTREMFLYSGLCYFCGAPVMPGKKVCEKHYLSNLNNLEKANAFRDTSNHPFAIDESLRYLGI